MSPRKPVLPMQFPTTIDVTISTPIQHVVNTTPVLRHFLYLFSPVLTFSHLFSPFPTFSHLFPPFFTFFHLFSPFSPSTYLYHLCLSLVTAIYPPDHPYLGCRLVYICLMIGESRETLSNNKSTVLTHFVCNVTMFKYACNVTMFKYACHVTMYILCMYIYMHVLQVGALGLFLLHVSGRCLTLCHSCFVLLLLGQSWPLQSIRRV